MTQANAYVFNVAEFDRQVDRFGYESTSNFARLSGVPRSTLMEYRSGASTPSLTNLARIMDMFPGVPIEALLRRNLPVAA